MNRRLQNQVVQTSEHIQRYTYEIAENISNGLQALVNNIKAIQFFVGLGAGLAQYNQSLQQASGTQMDCQTIISEIQQQKHYLRRLDAIEKAVAAKCGQMREAQQQAAELDMEMQRLRDSIGLVGAEIARIDEETREVARQTKLRKEKMGLE